MLDSLCFNLHLNRYLFDNRYLYYFLFDLSNRLDRLFLFGRPVMEPVDKSWSLSRKRSASCILLKQLKSILFVHSLFPRSGNSHLVNVEIDIIPILVFLVNHVDLSEYLVNNRSVNVDLSGYLMDNRSL
jgi:hypothetical protein